LRQWLEQGCFVLEGICDEVSIDEMFQDVDQVWSVSRGISDLRIEQLQLSDADRPGIMHTDLVEVGLLQRQRLRRKRPWRIHSFEEHSKAAKALFESPEIMRWISLILGTQPTPWNSIAFEYGSEQALHDDMAVAHIVPFNHLVGVWIACENIHPESGPLVYYPGSHRRHLFPGFQNYPQTNLRTCDEKTTRDYNEHLVMESRKFKGELLQIRKGDALLWHPMLIHGGSQVKNRHYTRRSFVCHYISPGADRSAEIEGPFNW
jgi:ectoine hydroxylase-related dioxygenase (phytanoyl-CoA dioxygenase family)